jgi:hypothetical protein
LTFYYTLFNNNGPFYLSNLEGSTLILGVEVKIAFQFLKFYIITTPLLIHVNLSKPFVLEAIAFNFTLNIVLSQFEEHDFF